MPTVSTLPAASRAARFTSTQLPPSGPQAERQPCTGNALWPVVRCIVAGWIVDWGLMERWPVIMSPRRAMHDVMASFGAGINRALGLIAAQPRRYPE
jgi:hypothetical protein